MRRFRGPSADLKADGSDLSIGFDLVGRRLQGRIEALRWLTSRQEVLRTVDGRRVAMLWGLTPRNAGDIWFNRWGTGARMWLIRMEELPDGKTRVGAWIGGAQWAGLGFHRNERLVSQILEGLP